MSGFVGYVSFSVVTFGFKIKIHRSNNGISAVSLKSSTVRCEPRMRLLATVNFFVWNFLTVKVMNWICKFGELERQEVESPLAKTPVVGAAQSQI